MTLLIKIVIGCLIAIAVAAIALVAGFFLFIRRAIRDCGSDSTPLTIHLHEDLAPEWLDSKEAAKMRTAFSDLGFKMGKPYDVEELEQVRLCSLFHAKYCGVIYQIDGMGLFYDIVHETPDGQMLTVTSTPFAEIFEAPPGLEKIFLKESTPREGFELIQQRCAQREAKTFNNDNFRDTVEGFYKKEQAHRNRNGGISFREFQDIAAMEKRKYTDKQLQQTFVSVKTDELQHWGMAGVEEYFETHNIPEEEQYSGGCYLFVPGKTDPRAFVHYLTDYDMVNEDDAETVAQAVKNETNIVQLFDQINASRSPDRRAVEKGKVSFPVEGTVYQLAA